MWNVVLTLKARWPLRQHTLDDLHGLLKQLHALAHRRKGPAITGVSFSGCSLSWNMRWSGIHTESRLACSQARTTASSVSKWLPYALG
jgi:hypothetical protein